MQVGEARVQEVVRPQGVPDSPKGVGQLPTPADWAVGGESVSGRTCQILMLNGYTDPHGRLPYEFRLWGYELCKVVLFGVLF